MPADPAHPTPDPDLPGFWSRILLPVASVLGSFAVGIAAAIASDALGANDDQVAAAAIVTASAGLGIFGLLLRARLAPHERRLSTGRRRSFGQTVGMGLVTGIGALIASGILISIALAVDPGTEDSLNEISEDLEGLDSSALVIALDVLSLVVLAPLGEELVFRALLLRGLVRRMSFRIAAPLSAVIFAAVHLDQYLPYPVWPRTLTLVVIGFLLALVYRARGYWAAVVAHATVNGVAAIALFVET